MKTTWTSENMYEHPAPHQAGVYGRIVLTEAGIYCLMVGGMTLSCPPSWAAKIHHDETTAKGDA